MYCRVGDLKHKFVINVRNGGKLGYVWDIEFDTVTAMAAAVVIRGRLRLFGLLGREEDVVVPWENIEVIGEDTILVNHTLPAYHGTKRVNGLFNILSDD